ncbi:unnamed protein product [Alopecurus aequalis]
MKASARGGGSRYRWVSELIDQHTMKWKEGLVRSIFPAYDADEILRIRLPWSNGEDYIAWHYEDSGNFSVRSAYRLALLESRNNLSTGQNSNQPDGDRSLWDVVWKTKVPQKVKIFTWRLATDALAVQTNRCARKMINDPTCTICGMEAEDGYHATMSCTKPKALREILRKNWRLPPERDLVKSGNNWTLIILSSVNEKTRQKLMFMWWRAWHLRNDIIFDKGKAEILASADFLCNYVNTLTNIREGRADDDTKGKKVMNNLGTYPTIVASCSKDPHWKPPDQGWHSLCIDASFLKSTNSGSWGAVIRDHLGQVASSAWGVIKDCVSAETAESLACLEGIKHALLNVETGVVIESDCLSLVTKISSPAKDRSNTASVVCDIQRLLYQLKDYKIRKIDREDNKAAHELAKFSRLEASGGVLQGTAPSCVLEMALRDCNQTHISN